MWECICKQQIKRGNNNHKKSCIDYQIEYKKILDQSDKIISIYTDTYSVEQVMDHVERHEWFDIETNPSNRLYRIIIQILKDNKVYDPYNKVALDIKLNKIKQTCLDRFGVDNISKLGGNGYCALNKIEYKKFTFDANFQEYKNKVSKLTSKNIKKFNIKFPQYCEYTGILFSDEEGISNPNDPRKRSIDHKLPVIHCYFNNISVEDAAHPNNLLFVLKYVNSLKSNTLHDSFLPLAYKIRKVFINEGFKSN